MNFHKKTDAASAEDAPLTPCPQMRTLLSRLADGSLGHGPLHWYATHHVAGCDHCETALMSLKAITERLRTLGTVDYAEVLPTLAPSPEGKGTPDALALTDDRWEVVREAWQAADSGGTGGGDADIK